MAGSPLGLVLKASVLAGSTVLAYHDSLATQPGANSGVMPLLWLSHVPSLVILVVIVQQLTARSDLDIHDRSLDYIIGGGLLGTALLMLCVLPVTLSLFFWIWRLDLLSLPFFVAGALSITFGIRALWRHRLPILLLFMTWPLPYTILIGSSSRNPIGVTNFVMNSEILSLFVQVRPSPAMVTEATFLFTNSFLTFLGTTTAIAIVARGGALAKVAWLLCALVVAWLLDLGQALLTLALAPQPLGRESSTSWTALVGTLSLATALASAFASMKLFRLRLVVVRPIRRWSARPAVRWAPFGLAVVLAAGWLAGYVNAGLPRYAPLTDNLGRSRISARAIADFSLPGWTVAHSEEHRWAAVYLDKSATWTRYAYEPLNGLSGSARPTLTVDVISTTDLSLLSTYGIEESYRLQQHPRLTDASVDLGSGVVGRLASYSLNGAGARWTGLHWQWPVMGTTGLRYERIVMSARESLNDLVSPPTLRDDGVVATELAFANILFGSAPAQSALSTVKLSTFLAWAGREFVTAALVQSTASESRR